MVKRGRNGDGERGGRPEREGVRGGGSLFGVMRSDDCCPGVSVLDIS